MTFIKVTAGFVTIGVAIALLAGPALADSGPLYASGQQCVAEWFDRSGDHALQFRIRDKDRDDNDYCYVAHGWRKKVVKQRLDNPEDVAESQYYDVDVSDHAEIWFKVCKERQHDPDVCSSVHGPYGT